MLDMNPEVRKLWTEALRSGRYPQTTQVLRSCYGFCCLGVLCDLAVAANVIPPPVVDDFEIFEYGREHKYEELPIEVQEWAGLTSGDPVLIGNQTCTTANDRLRLSFNEIADLIDGGFTDV
jgi:hypothetical protein